jgi:hypothetical protein
VDERIRREVRMCAMRREMEDGVIGTEQAVSIAEPI